MLTFQRQREILSYIANRKSAQVQELSDLFNISLATVRRDLAQMEEEGVIRRVHGGAVFIENLAEPPALQRRVHHPEYKQRIGRAAADLVGDGETILITSGTTTEAMIPFLAGKHNLTVITNAINAAYQLAHYPDISVIVLGGWLRHSEFSLLGHLTEQALQDLRADRVFHGVFGISAEHGLTGSYLQEAQTDRALIAAASALIVLADHTKFGQIGPIRLAPTQAVAVVVTDMEAPAPEVQKLMHMGISVIQA